MRFGARHPRGSTLVPGGARTRRALAFAALISAVLVALAGCGSGSGSTTTTHAAQEHRPTTLDIYASLPLSGPQSAQARSVLNGIKLSLSQLPDGKAGAYRLKLRTYNDSSPRTRGWSAAAVNARRAATNPDAVLYIGELDSGASAASIPILTEASIPQISPGSTATYLTGPKAPDQATFLRLVPDDGIAAKANLFALRKLGCTHTWVVGDRGGQSLISAMRAAPSKDGVDLQTIDRNSALAPKTTAAMASYVALAHSVPPECVFYSGVASPQAVALIRALRASLPASVAVVGSSQLCDASWARAVAPPSTTGQAAGATTPANTTATVSADGQTTTTATTRTTATTTTPTHTTTTGDQGPPPDTGLWCTSPTPDLNALPLGRAFNAAYKRHFNDHAPDLPAVFGYEAMGFGIRAIKALGVNADSRQLLLEKLHGLCMKESALGAFTFDASGDSTLTTYSLYKVNAGGSLGFDKSLKNAVPSGCSPSGR